MRAKKPVHPFRSQGWLREKRDSVHVMMKIAQPMPTMRANARKQPAALRRLARAEEEGRRKRIIDGLDSVIELAGTEKHSQEIRGGIKKTARELRRELKAKRSLLGDPSFSNRLKQFTETLSSNPRVLFMDEDVAKLFRKETKKIAHPVYFNVSAEEGRAQEVGAILINPLPITKHIALTKEGFVSTEVPFPPRRQMERLRILSSPHGASRHEAAHIQLMRKGIAAAPPSTFNEFIAFLKAAEKYPQLGERNRLIHRADADLYNGMLVEAWQSGGEHALGAEYASTARRLGINAKQILNARRQDEDLVHYRYRVLGIFRGITPEYMDGLTPARRKKLRSEVLKELKG